MLCLPLSIILLVTALPDACSAGGHGIKHNFSVMVWYTKDFEVWREALPAKYNHGSIAGYVKEMVSNADDFYLRQKMAIYHGTLVTDVMCIREAPSEVSNFLKDRRPNMETFKGTLAIWSKKDILNSADVAVILTSNMMFDKRRRGGADCAWKKDQTYGRISYVKPTPACIMTGISGLATFMVSPAYYEQPKRLLALGDESNKETCQAIGEANAEFFGLATPTTEEPSKPTTEEPSKPTEEEPKPTEEEPKSTEEEPSKSTEEEPSKPTTEEPKPTVVEKPKAKEKENPTKQVLIFPETTFMSEEEAKKGLAERFGMDASQITIEEFNQKTGYTRFSLKTTSPAAQREIERAQAHDGNIHLSFSDGQRDEPKDNSSAVVGPIIGVCVVVVVLGAAVAGFAVYKHTQKPAQQPDTAFNLPAPVVENKQEFQAYPDDII